MTQLGRLERVDLRKEWVSEPLHFTPWLAQEENLILLGETLKLDLQLEAQEQSVGPFRADILCKDTADDTWVLIENQLGRTDHLHLGQLLTYAAGLKAVTIVWIAGRFAEEHRAACDWLNETTIESVRFFALEIELWRIGDSLSAPKFNVVSMPNDWSKSVATVKIIVAQGNYSELRKHQLQYWTTFNELIDSRAGPIKRRTPQAESWQEFSIGRTGFLLSAAINAGERRLRAALFIQTNDAKQFFGELRNDKSEIEMAFGGALDWDPLPNHKGVRIGVTLTDAAFDNVQDWPRQQEWLVKKLETLHLTFAHRVCQLKPFGYPSNNDVQST